MDLLTSFGLGNRESTPYGISALSCYGSASQVLGKVGLTLPSEGLTADIGLWLCSIDVDAARGYAFVFLVTMLTISVTPQVAGGMYVS